MSEHPSGIETRDVASGWQGVVHHGDGSVTKTWGRTEAEAEQRAHEVVSDE